MHRVLPSLKLVIMALVLGSLAAPLPLAAPVTQARGKTSVKVAMVYNIIRFINFPKKPGRLRVCGVAGDLTSRNLRVLEGRTVGQSRIEVKILASANSINANCHIIYLDSASPRSIGALARGQVLIGSRKNFAKNGGTVGLINFGGQVRFVVNDTIAKRAGISFRAQLLQLAAKVIA